MKYAFRIAIMTILTFVSAKAGIWIRYNQAGYVPNRPKSIIVQSDVEIQGRAWTLRQGTNTLFQGTLGSSFTGIQPHTAKAFHYRIGLDSLQTPGEFSLEISGAAPATIRILQDPYSLRITQALRHLRVMRSGSEGLLLHGPSHMGDSAAIVHIPEGTLANGAWVAANPRRTVNMVGGHYDAGDYIKFTLNEAYLAYHLLQAYLSRPTLFPKVYSPSELPDILDEARHSLQYLARTLPDANTFVIQVGSQEDHNQGNRLPESDILDGNRKALCVISRAHMGVTAAALALGSRVFAQVGFLSESNIYRERALAIYHRARQSDAVPTAFERDQTNDFYHDQTDADNMALAAAELYALTQDPNFLEQARQYAPPADYEVSWTTWNAAANLALAPFDNQAGERALQETLRYATYAATHPWNIPGGYTWASLHRWMGAAHASVRANSIAPSDSLQRVALGVLDYIFGRSPWGVSFQFSLDLPNTVRNIYGQIYPLLGEFPTGAVSEGPGEIEMHRTMRQYFTVPVNDPLEEFNTSAAVFYDNGRDFMLQEATIVGQADFILLMALVSDSSVMAVADSGTTREIRELPSDTVRIMPLSSLTCFTFDDRSAGGVSTVSQYQKSADAVSMILQPRTGGTVTYPYAGVDCKFVAGQASPFDMVVLRMDIPQGLSLRVTFPQTDIGDYGYHGMDIAGRGLSDYVIPFAELNQTFGNPVPFNTSRINGIDLTASVPSIEVPLRLLGVEFRGDDQFSLRIKTSRQPTSLNIRREGSLFHLQWRNNQKPYPTEIRDSSGRLITLLHRGPDGSFVWNASSRPPGVYQVRRRGNSESARIVWIP